MKRILTVTPNPALDSTTRVEQVLAGRKLRCEPAVRYPGGGGINVARAVKQLGGESCCAIWTRGGVIGGVLGSLLDEEGVAHVPVDVVDETRENVLVYDRSAEAHYRFGMPGPEISFEEAADVVSAVRDADPGPDYIVASGSLPRGESGDIYIELARLCAERGCRLVLDTETSQLERSLETAPVYLIKPNFNEFGRLVGSTDLEDEEIAGAARSLIESGKVEVVVVTLGSAGAILVTADEDHRIQAPTVRVKSRIGAGDSTVAGIVLALTREEALLDAVRFGVACGAAAVMTPGTELCRREDAERLYRHMSEVAGTDRL